MSIPLFLDIDGVFNSVDFWKNRKEAHKQTIEHLNSDDRIRFFNLADLDPQSISIFEKVIERFDVEIIISSVWRMGYTVDELKRLFHLVGADIISERIVDKTKVLEGIRGHEVQEWLDRHPHSHYFIIDDDSDFLPDQKLASRFIQTNHDAGFTEVHAERLRRILVQLECEVEREREVNKQ